MKDEAGDWYWTLNGELMLDQDGNPIRANGHDGTDGEPGQDGQDGHDGQAGEPGQPGEPGTPGKPGADAPTPQIKLGSTLAGNTCYGIDGKKEDSPAESAWYLSVDDGKTWYRISGEKGAAGDDGDKGEKGERAMHGWLVRLKCQQTGCITHSLSLTMTTQTSMTTPRSTCRYIWLSASVQMRLTSLQELPRWR